MEYGKKMAEDRIFPYKDLDCTGRGNTRHFDFVLEPQTLQDGLEMAATQFCNAYPQASSREECLKVAKDQIGQMPSSVCDSSQRAMWIPQQARTQELKNQTFAFYLPQENVMTREMFVCVDKERYDNAKPCQPSCAYDDPEMCRQQETCTWTGIPQTNVGACHS